MLSGFVEIDDAYIGSQDENGKRGRGTNKTKIVAGLSLDEKRRPQFLKMSVVDKLDSDTMSAFASYHFNRRFNTRQIFNRLVLSCLSSEKINYAELTT